MTEPAPVRDKLGQKMKINASKTVIEKSELLIKEGLNIKNKI